MRRLIVILMMALLASAVYAQDYKTPDFGAYEATTTQIELNENGESGMWQGEKLFFRIGLSPDAAGEAWLLWDYDGDGRIDDEELETYDYQFTDTALYFRDSVITYFMFTDTDTGQTWVVLDFRQEKTTIAVELEQIESW